MVPLEERPLNISIPPRRQEVGEIRLLKYAMRDNEFKLVYYIYTINNTIY